MLEDFLAGDSAATEFFQASYLSADSRKAWVSKVAERKIHPTVLAELNRLNSGKSSALDGSLAKLAAGAVAVVTGQQLGVLGGPLLTFYKSLGAIAFARLLEKETGHAVVPIFWLQAEDQDFDEIKEASFLGEGEELSSVSLKDPQGLIGDSVGYLGVDKNFQEEVAQLLLKLGGFDAVRDKILDAYGVGRTLDLAFSELLHAVLGSEGLLVFSPLAKSLKLHCKDLIASSFLRSRALENLIQTRIDWIQSLGYEAQVPVKPRSPLFFVSSSQGRERLIESAEGTWSGRELTLTKESLYKLLDESPEKFTSSALIRPIMQDYFLPTVAYVAGPNEFNYWVQLRPLYEFFGITQPLVVPRPRFTLLEDKYLRILEKAGATLQDLRLSAKDFVAKRLAKSRFDPDELFPNVLSKSTSALDELKAIFEQVDGNLSRGLEQTKAAIETNVQKLRSKYERALMQREEAVLKQFERVQRVVYPLEKNQEAVISSANFFLLYGFEIAGRILSQITLESFGHSEFLSIDHSGQIKRA